MARPVDALEGGEDEGVSLRTALKLLAWAGLAASAVAVTMLAARTEVGAQRLARILSGPATAAADSIPVQKADPLPARLAETENEALRLAEMTRRLAADRDQMITRLDALERNLDVTASLREKAPEAPPAGASSLPAPPPAPPSAAAAAPSQQLASLPPSPLLPAVSAPANILAPVPAINAAPPAPRPGAIAPPPPAAEQANLGPVAGPAADSTTNKTEFGVDLGGDRTVDALRALWTSLRSGKHAPLFAGLRPIVAIREGGKPAGLELRLVVGPLANAGAAARLCGTLAAGGLACQPTVFDGQRLALR
jgi:hypothetical protein